MSTITCGYHVPPRTIFFKPNKDNDPTATTNTTSPNQSSKQWLPTNDTTVPSSNVNERNNVNSRKKIRRGKKKAKDINIYYNNINGFKSKMSSLKVILEKEQPHVIALCETKLSKNSHGLLEETVDKKNYKIIPRYTKYGKEGMMVAIRNNTFQNILDVTHSQLNTIVSVRASTGTYSTRIILGYAPQEDETEQSEEFFDELELEIKMCIEAGDLPILLGDFNSKINPSEDSPYGTPQSKNGNLLYNILAEHNLHILNFTKLCTGKWTHVIRTTGASSVLDYIAVHRQTLDNVKSMLIDESGILCPFRVTKKNGVSTSTLSDHNALLLKLQIPRCNKPSQKEHINQWIIKPNGYSKMEQMFESNCDSVEVDYKNPQKTYNSYESMVDKVLDTSFKTTEEKKNSHSFKNSLDKSLKPLCTKLTQFASRGKVQRKVAVQYRTLIIQMNTEKVSEINAQRLMKRVENLSENDRFSAQNFWKAKKSIQSSIRTCNSVYDEEENEVFEDAEIIEAYRKEFDNRLSSVDIKPELQNYKERTEELCTEILKLARTQRQPDFSREEYDKVVNKLQEGKAHGLDKKPAEVFKHGGDNFRNLTLRVLNCIKNTHSIPTQWELMKITPLYKGKGSQKRLVNQRGIFLTQVLSKIWERLIKERIRSIVSRINKLQGGSRNGKGTPDQVFLIRACINHARYTNSPLYLNFYDFKQCFDKIWLQDSIISLYKLGLMDEHLAHIYELNSKAEIEVNTPLGTTKRFIKNAIVKQGSVTAGSLCSASTGEFCDEHIRGGVQIGKMKINSVAYVDDLTTANIKVTDASDSHKEVCFFSDKKKQPLNEDKCFLLPLFLKQCDPIPTQTVNGKEVRVVSEAPCLGDIFNNRGTYKDLIDDRVRRGKMCTVNCLSTCSTSEFGKYTINSLLLLYRTVFLQTILFNSETWDNIPQNAIDRLHSLQMKYLKWMLHSPRGTPNAVVMLELGVFPIRQEIDARKFMFLHHILNLDPDDPVRCSYQQQQLYVYEKNWGNEMNQTLVHYNLPVDLNLIQHMSLTKWKSMVKQTITTHAFTCLINNYTTLEKASRSHYTECKQQSYFNFLSPQDSRTWFQVRAGVYDIKCNRSYMYSDNECRLCENGDEDIFHIINQCPNVPRSSIGMNSLYGISDEEIIESVSKVNFFKNALERKLVEENCSQAEDL